MKVSPESEHPPIGLRERKKAKTRAAIQEHALRLFQQQGYAATTVEQIAEAAEVSPSTFFRYFPTKEDVVLYDDLDPLLVAAFAAQPAALGPLAALRGALREVFTALSSEEAARQWERSALILEVPELRRRMLDQFVGTIDLLSEMVAQRTGRRPDDLAVRSFAGAVVGALMGAYFSAPEKAGSDLLARIDASLGFLEAGLPL